MLFRSHQHARLAQRIAEGIEGSIEQRGRQPPGEQAEIGGHLARHFRIHRHRAEQPLRIAQEKHARHRQCQRQPEALLQHAGHLAVALRPVQLRDDWRHRLQDADQREHHRDLDAAADRHRRQIGGADVAEHGGIDHHHADGRKLGDQDRESMGDEAPDGGEQHGARLSHAPHTCCGRPAKTGQIDLAQAALPAASRKFAVQEGVQNE